ncbi:hypothetical protein ACE6H2_006754 [Prunus campanulata]
MGYTSDMSDLLSSFRPQDDTTVGNRTLPSSLSARHGTKSLSSGSTCFTFDGFTFETPEYHVLESQFDTQSSPLRDRNRFWVPFTPIK